MKPQTRQLTLGLFVASVLALAGCSAVPTAPVLTATDYSTPGLPVEGSVIERTESGDVPSDNGVQQSVGVQGATLNVGRFTVNIPAGALQDQTVVLLSTDGTGMQMDLNLSPKTDLFAVPVTVTADVAGLFHPGRIKNTYLAQFDGASQAWVRLANSKVNMGTKRVSGSSQACATFKIQNSAVSKH